MLAVVQVRRFESKVRGQKSRRSEVLTDNDEAVLAELYCKQYLCYLQRTAEHCMLQLSASSMQRSLGDVDDKSDGPKVEKLRCGMRLTGRWSTHRRRWPRNCTVSIPLRICRRTSRAAPSRTSCLLLVMGVGKVFYDELGTVQKRRGSEDRGVGGAFACKPFGKVTCVPFLMPNHERHRKLIPKYRNNALRNYPFQKVTDHRKIE